MILRHPMNVVVEYNDFCSLLGTRERRSDGYVTPLPSGCHPHSKKTKRYFTAFTFSNIHLICGSKLKRYRHQIARCNLPGFTYRFTIRIKLKTAKLKEPTRMIAKSGAYSMYSFPEIVHGGSTKRTEV